MSAAAGQRARDAVYDIGVDVLKLSSVAGILQGFLLLTALCGGFLAIACSSVLAQGARAGDPGAVARGALDSHAGLSAAVLGLVAAAFVAVALRRLWVRRATALGVRMAPFGATPLTRRNPMRRPAIAATVAAVALIAVGAIAIRVGNGSVAVPGLVLMVAGALLVIPAAFLWSEVIRLETWRLRSASSLIHGFTGTALPSGELLRDLPNDGQPWPTYAAILIGGIALAVFAGLNPISGFECAAPLTRCDVVTVPFDWEAPDNGRRLEIAYGVIEPTGTPLGTLLLAAGGPGASGLADASEYATYVDPAIRNRYRLVLFDPRGVGRSGARDCPHEAGELEIGNGGTRSAELFAERCLVEAGVALEDAGLYRTSQVVEDVEAIRTALGIEQFAMYGVSYGSVTAQAYAERHPDRLSALILDAPVDRALTAAELWTSAAEAGEATLEAVFRACRDDLACDADLPDPEAAYARLIERVTDRELDLPATDPDGVRRMWTVNRELVEELVFNLLYDPYGRMVLQRALAGVQHGDDATLGAMLLGGYGQEAPSLITGDPNFSDFLFYATSCSDYRTSPNENDHDRRSLIEGAREGGVLDLRMAGVFLVQIPCLYWPSQPDDPARPAALSDLPFPTFIVVSTADPITPASYGRAIASALEDVYLIEVDGGAHGMLWRGDPCIDSPVSTYLTAGRRPSSTMIQCAAQLTDWYVPISPQDATSASALNVMRSVENEIWGSGSFVYWDGVEPVRIGCLRSGHVEATELGDEVRFTFRDCEHIRDVVVDGSGTFHGSTGLLSFDVSIAGEELHYRSTATGARVTGTYRGRTVDESD